MLGVYIGVFEDVESIPGVYILFWAIFGPKLSQDGPKLGQKGVTRQIKIGPNLSLTFICKYGVCRGDFEDAESILGVYILFRAISEPKLGQDGKMGQKGATRQVKIGSNLWLTFISKYVVYTGFFDDAESIPDVYILFPAIIWA